MWTNQSVHKFYTFQMSYIEDRDVQSAEQKRSMEQILIQAKTTEQALWLLCQGCNKHIGALWVSWHLTEVDPTRWS